MACGHHRGRHLAEVTIGLSRTEIGNAARQLRSLRRGTRSFPRQRQSARSGERDGRRRRPGERYAPVSRPARLADDARPGLCEPRRRGAGGHSRPHRGTGAGAPVSRHRRREHEIAHRGGRCGIGQAVGPREAMLLAQGDFLVLRAARRSSSIRYAKRPSSTIEASSLRSSSAGGGDGSPSCSSRTTWPDLPCLMRAPGARHSPR